MLFVRHLAARTLSGRLSVYSLALIAAVVAAPCARAQFQSLPIDESAKRLGMTRAKSYARSPTDDAERRREFGLFIKNYYLPLMTQYDAASLGELARLRSDYVRSFLRNADPTVAKGVTTVTLPVVKQVVEARCHPAVRYNAMLLIGELDAEYASRGGSSEPKPLPEANEYLTKYVSDGINDAGTPAPLIVGALIGLERHAAAYEGLPPANRTATANALLAVLEKDDMPHDIQPSVAQWMKVIAARGLAGFGALGDGNKVHLAMMKAIGDEDTRLNTRVRIAEQLEAYKAAYQSATGIDEQKTAQTMLQLATDITSDEQERAVEFEESALGPGGGMGGMRGGYRGGFGGGFSGDAELPSEYQARRVLLRLSGLKKGIEAVKPTVKDARLVGMLDDVVKAINPVISQAADRDIVELTLADNIKQMAASVADTTAALGVEAVEAPPESDEEAAEEMMEEGAAQPGA